MTVQLTGIFDPVVRLTGRIGLFVPPKPIWTNLVAWWSLDEAGGVRADSHGNYDLTDATGATPQVADGVVAAGAGMRTTGSHYLYSVDNGLSSNGESFAFAGWVRLLAAETSGVIVARNNNPLDAPAGRDYEISISNRAANPGLSVYARNRWIDISTVAARYPVGTNTWHFFAAGYRVIDATNAQLFIRVDDFTYAADVLTTPAATTASIEFRLGRRAGSFPAPVNVDLDEIAYWQGYVPTAEEVEWLFNEGAGRSYADFAAEFGP